MRKWVETLSPKQANDILGCYDQGIWMKDMDRCWHSDDGIQVTSRIIMTEWGKVEHAAITKSTSVNGKLTCQDDVMFKDLMYVVIDEQHKF